MSNVVVVGVAWRGRRVTGGRRVGRRRRWRARLGRVVWLVAESKRRTDAAGEKLVAELVLDLQMLLLLHQRVLAGADAVLVLVVLVAHLLVGAGGRRVARRAGHRLQREQVAAVGERRRRAR